MKPITDKLFLALACFAAGVLLFAAQALAELPRLGVITSASGASTSNGVIATATAVPFAIPPQVKYTVWCDAPVNWCEASTVACTATTGQPLAVREKFPSVGYGQQTVTIAGQKSALVSAFGVGAFNCYVSQRTGNE